MQVHSGQGFPTRFGFLWHDILFPLSISKFFTNLAECSIGIMYLKVKEILILMFHRYLKSKFSDALFTSKILVFLLQILVTFLIKLNFMKIHPFDHCAGYFLLAAATDTVADALGQSTLFHFIVAVDAPMHDVRTMQHYSYQKLHPFDHCVQYTALFSEKKTSTRRVRPDERAPYDISDRSPAGRAHARAKVKREQVTLPTQLRLSNARVRTHLQKRAQYVMGCVRSTI